MAIDVVSILAINSCCPCGHRILADEATGSQFTVEVFDRETREPVEGATVKIVGHLGVKVSTSISTDSAGRASSMLPRTTDSVSHVTIRAKGYHPYHTAFDSGRSTSKDPSKEKRVAMRPGKLLQGRVIDEQGNPISGVRITTTDASDESIHGYFYTLFDLETDQAGRFSFDSVDPHSDLRLQFSHPRYKTRWLASDVSGEMEIQLANDKQVAGTIRSFRGQPVNNATVVSVGENVSVRSDKNGKFDLGMVHGSPLQVVVTADQSSPQLVRVDEFDDANDLSVRLLPGRTIRFRVIDERGEALSDVRITSRFWRETSALRLNAVTDDGGLATLRNAPADVVEYEFSLAGYLIRSTRLKAESKVHQIKLVKPESSKATKDAAASKSEVELVAATDHEILDIDPTNAERRIMHLCDIDGMVLRPLISDVKLRHRLDRHGTPDVSQDGSTIAYDAWSTSNSEDWEDARIVVANIDGSQARDIGYGVIPSLSPNGQHLVFSRPRKHAPNDDAQGQSIWTMKTDGTNKKMIADHYAWGGRWTADGTSIVFRGGNDDQGKYVSGNCLRVYDLQTETTRNVFSPEESPFSSLKFQLNVSRQSRLAIMKGTLRDGNGAIAVIDIDRGLESIRLLKPRHPDLPHFAISVGGVSSFSSDDQWFATACKNKGRLVGHAIHIDKLFKPRPFRDFPKDLVIVDPTFTPDGKHVIVSIGTQ